MNRKQYGHELALKREIKEPAIKNHSPELQSGFTFRWGRFRAFLWFTLEQRHKASTGGAATRFFGWLWYSRRIIGFYSP